MELTFSTAFLIGLLGSTHCIGMCGGIVGTLNVSVPQSHGPSRLSRIAYHFTYNAGRIASYAIAGALAGLIGSQATRFFADSALPIGTVIAGLFMIALGLYLTGWWRGIEAIDKAGQRLWRVVEPMGRRFMPPKTAMHVFGLGLVWGWLPCGLVYSALVLATVSASPVQGVFLMLGFGLGTLPMLLVMGNVAGQLRTIMQHSIVRGITGAVIILFGVYTCVTAFSGHQDSHSTSDNGIREQAAASNCPNLHSDDRSLDQVRYLV